MRLNLGLDEKKKKKKQNTRMEVHEVPQTITPNQEKYTEGKGNALIGLGNEMARAFGSKDLGSFMDKQAMQTVAEKFTLLHEDIAKELGYENAADMSAKVQEKYAAETPIQ